MSSGFDSRVTPFLPFVLLPLLPKAFFFFFSSTVAAEAQQATADARARKHGDGASQWQCVSTLDDEFASAAGEGAASSGAALW